MPLLGCCMVISGDRDERISTIGFDFRFCCNCHAACQCATRCSFHRYLRCIALWSVGYSLNPGNPQPSTFHNPTGINSPSGNFLASSLLQEFIMKNFVEKMFLLLGISVSATHTGSIKIISIGSLHLTRFIDPSGIATWQVMRSKSMEKVQLLAEFLHMQIIKDWARMQTLEVLNRFAYSEDEKISLCMTPGSGHSRCAEKCYRAVLEPIDAEIAVRQVRLKVGRYAQESASL